MFKMDVYSQVEDSGFRIGFSSMALVWLLHTGVLLFSCNSRVAYGLGTADRFMDLGDIEKECEAEGGLHFSRCTMSIS